MPLRCQYARWRHAGEQYDLRAISRAVPHDWHARWGPEDVSSQPIDEAQRSRASRNTSCTSSQSWTSPCSTSSNRFVSLPMCTSSLSVTGRRWCGSFAWLLLRESPLATIGTSWSTRIEGPVAASSTALHAIEKILPLAVFDSEWEVVVCASRPDLYLPNCHIEQRAPWVVLTLSSGRLMVCGRRHSTGVAISITSLDASIGAALSLGCDTR